jgi:hypothetical protein
MILEDFFLMEEKHAYNVLFFQDLFAPGLTAGYLPRIWVGEGALG